MKLVLFIARLSDFFVSFDICTHELFEEPIKLKSLFDEYFVQIAE